MPRPKRHPDEPRFAKALGAAIRVARKRRGLKAYALAQDVGVTEQTISFWETGKALPYTPHLLVLCDVLGVRLSQLYAAAERVIWAQDVMAVAAARQPVESEEDRKA